MIRDHQRSVAYWNERIAYKDARIPTMWEILRKPDRDESYAPQYAFEISNIYREQMVRRYSRGDAVSDLDQYFPGLLDAWEEAERLGKDVWSEQIQYTRHAWTVNLDHYVRCFWLTGLALTLDIPDDQWQRLLVLMGNEGEDALLDRVIASRQAGRKIGDKICFPKAYRQLLKVIDTSDEKRPQLLRDYLDDWFASLKDAGSPSFPRDHRTPYWWDFCTEEGRAIKGGYFGCWCIEAAAVVKAFGIDDSLCLDHPHYPGDLIQDGRSPRYADPNPSLEPEMSRGELDHTVPQKRQRSWLSRLLLGPEKHQ